MKGYSMGFHGVNFLFGFYLIACLAIVWNPNLTEALELDKCTNALGMETSEIPDEALSASSVYDPSVGAQNARIRTESMGGAWCPEQEIAHDVYEFLQIDLGVLKVITMVETQGRFGGGQGQEYAEQYKLEYQREENGTWFKFRNRRGGDIFEANSNTYATEMNVVDPPIIARQIRILPYSAYEKTVCMRVELFGCVWEDHLVSYDMPQGHRRGGELDLIDYTYDGTVKKGELTNGLGQLTDGVTGSKNFRLDPTNTGHKGYEWIGWRNDSLTESPPIEIIFKMDSVRNFSSMSLHTSNVYSKDVTIFRMAKIYFSIGGEYYNTDPKQFNYMKDTLIEYERTVQIPLENRIGRYVKLHLYFDSKWILISEVGFTSEAAEGNYVAETGPVVMVTKNPTHNKPQPGSGRKGNPMAPKDKTILDQGEEIKLGEKNNEDQDNGVVDYEENYISDPNLSEEVIGTIIGALTVLIVLFVVIFIVVCLRNKRRKDSNNHMKTLESQHSPYNVNDFTLGVTNMKMVNGYNFVTSSDIDSDRDVPVCCNPSESDYNNGELQSRKLPELPKTPDSTDTNVSRDYAVPTDLTKTALIVNSPFKATTLGRRNTAPRSAATLGYHPNIVNGSLPYSSTQPYATSTLPSIQGVSGNNVYAAPGNLDLMWREDPQLMEFDKDNLQLVEKLGEGQFGEVHLCEARDVTNMIGDDFLVNRTGSKSMLVAVKMLRPDAGEQARLDFHKEVKIMCQLRDPNIVQVLGVCNRVDYLCVIVEYMKYGDLNQYLQKHCLEGASVTGSDVTPLSYGCLIYMATQIASGMKYLESLNMVHRDLASRNCLVGNLYTIKISDFGMSRSLYSSDYYRIEGKAVLPIRWMAWESVLLGKFSSKSDVWSFGVTMWEILTFAREQPYDSLTDEQVIENCGHFYRKDGLEQYLAQPMYCPKEIFDLMYECWNHDESARPAFKEIHMFLQRKNMGYNPKDEKTAFNVLPPSSFM